MYKLLFCLLSIGFSGTLAAQKIIHIPFGDMDRWMVRVIEESKLIGGNTRYIYEIVNGDTVFGNVPYVPKTSKWATSSVYAKVSGVSKASSTVFPEPRGNGMAARLETRLEHVKVLGLININALATGTVFLGELLEPIKDTKNPQAKLMKGIPFTEKPNFLQFDYKFVNGNGGQRIKSTGFSKEELVSGINAAEISVLLQQRWEDAEGNVYAKRVGTGCIRYQNEMKEWRNGTRIEIHYGDISKEPYFRDYMGLTDKDPYYCRNKSGEPSKINEVGWAEPGTAPTHIMIQFSSGYGGAYIGAPGAKLWIDNVALGYNK